MIKISNLHFAQKGLAREYNSHGLEYLFGSISVSKSLGNQIGQCDLFLNFNWQVSK